MKIGNLLSKVLPTKKSGTSDPVSAISAQLTYFIQFSNLEDNPLYELSSSLSIGSQAGDVVVDDPSLSPKHCTIFLNQDVISVLDHGSREGTFIKEHQIPAGRMVILADGDFIRIGELELDVVSQQVKPSPLIKADTPKSGSAPNLDSTQEIVLDPNAGLSLDLDEEEIELTDEELSLDKGIDSVAEQADDSDPDFDKTADIQIPENFNEEPLDKKPGLFSRIFTKKDKNIETQKDINEQSEAIMDDQQKRPGLFARIFKKKNVAAKPVVTKLVKPIKKKINIQYDDDDTASTSANALSRSLAVLADSLLAYSLYLIMGPMELSWQFYEDITQLIALNYTKFLQPHVDTHLAAYIAKVPQMIWELVKEGIPYLGVLYLFLGIRVISTLILGRSFGQLLLGISAKGNIIWTRIGGVLREILAPILLPFIVLDIVVLFGKRSLKEALTFTKIQINSKLAFFGGLFLGLPIVVVIFLVSPLLKGGKLTPVIAFKPLKSVEGKPLESPVSIISNYFRLKFFIDNKLPYTTYPGFELTVKNGKKTVYPVINFHSQTLGENLQLIKLKSFNLSALLKYAVQSDPLLEKKFPSIKKFVTDVGQGNKNFKKAKLSKKEQALFMKEISTYITAAFKLDFASLGDHAKVYGPFLKGYVDIRDELKRLSGLESVSEVLMKTIGSTPYLVLAEYQAGRKGKVKLSYFPLNAGSAVVNQLVLSNAAKKNKEIENFESLVLANVEVLAEDVEKVTSSSKASIDSMEIFDFYFNNDSIVEREATLQHFYQLIYDNSAQAMRLGNAKLIDLLKFDTKKLIKVFGVLQSQELKKLAKLHKVEEAKIKNTKAKVVSKAVTENPTEDNNTQQKPAVDPAKQMESIYNRLIQKLNEILNALEQRDLEFFGATIRA
jgi:pSer/pThr/pTyr-binding forkhead associated (FHA) protein